MLFHFSLVPFCTVVLATEHSHFFVVEKGNSSQRSFLCVIDVAADILCWGKKKRRETEKNILLVT